MSGGAGQAEALSDLGGLSLIVTGGSAGIGDAIVALAKSLGARVGVLDMVPSPRADAHAVADVSDAQEVADAVQGLAGDLGGISVLVNNAGIATPGAFDELSEQQWRHTLAVNLDGTFHCSRAALPHLRQAPGGAIVNIASIAGRSYSRTASVAYAASKGGVIAFTRQLAYELAAERIRVNCVCPGLVDTRIMARNTDPQRLSELVSTIPLGRLAAPADVAGTVCFLASAAAAYLTGAVIDVTGGLT